MKFGDSGEQITSLQKALTKVGYPVVIDGQFGAVTEKAVKDLQTANSIVVDGIVGPTTLQKIDALEAALSTSPATPVAPVVPSAPPTPAPLPTSMGVIGLDTSHWEGKIDWPQITKDGFSFVSMKCTEGLGSRDANYVKDWAAAKANGLYRFAYHFFHPNLDARGQANFFLTSMGGLFPNDIAPCLDLEQMNGVTPKKVIAQALIFLQQCQVVTKKKPIIYTMPDMMNQLGHPKEFAEYPLWLAAPGHKLSNVKVPKPWTSLKFLQTSFTGHVQGIHGTVDLDVFNGTKADLETFARSTV